MFNAHIQELEKRDSFSNRSEMHNWCLVGDRWQQKSARNKSHQDGRCRWSNITLVLTSMLANFYGTTKYITEWILPLHHLKLMSWIILRKNNTWEDVRKSPSFMKKKIILTQSPDETGFDEYCWVSKYMNENSGILKKKILAPSHNAALETVFTR